MSPSLSQVNRGRYGPYCSQQGHLVRQDVWCEAVGVEECALLALSAGVICREEGLLGLWKGLGPNIARNAIINAAELASYDQIKVSLLETGGWVVTGH